MTPEERRRWLNRRARERAAAEGIGFRRALYRVRRSEVLLYLDRQSGRDVPAEEVVRNTAVPASVVRRVHSELRRKSAAPPGAAEKETERGI